MKSFKDFANLYKLSKTLRFELKPTDKTLENIEKNGLLEQDKHRADSYKEVKKIIDEYHKAFIEKSLSNFKLKNASENKRDSLSEYKDIYVSKDKDDIKGYVRTENLKKVQENLRKQISNQLTQYEIYKRIDKKELIKEDLLNFVKTVEEKQLVVEFKDFTTYFTGFHENRKNMYSDEEKSTAIAYRLINENLPKFVDNMRTFEKVAASAVSDNFAKLYSDFEEDLNVESIADIFNLDYYSMVLIQPQIDVYNAIIGGRPEEQGKPKIKGLNEYINLYNQQQKDKSARLPKLKPLFKQILSDRNAIFWLHEEFESDNDVLDSIEKCYQALVENIFEDRVGEHRSLKKLMLGLKDFDLHKIYIRNDLQLTDISKQMFGDWGIIQRSIDYYYKQNNLQKQKETNEKYEERIKKLMNLDSFSIGFINDCLKNAGTVETIEDYFATLGVKNNETEQKENLFTQIGNAYAEVKELLNTDYPDNKNLSQDKVAVEKIKALLDAIKALQWFVKPLLGKGNEPDKDERFYGEFSTLWEQLDAITPLYNKVRNRMTRKPYSTEKIKLNFENKGQFLGGWVDSRTENSDNGTQAGGYLFRKKNEIGEYDYYLGISADPKLFRMQKNAKGCYERLDYYQPKSSSIYGNSYVGENGYDSDKKTLINSIESFISNLNDFKEKTDIKSDFAKIKAEQKTPSRLLEILSSNKNYINIYNRLLDDNQFAIENNRVTDNLHRTICSLTRIEKSKGYKNVTFHTFVEAQKAIEDLCKEKVFDYFVVSDDEIESAQNKQNKPLYLFKIINKDLSYAETYSKGLRKSRGTDNLHTLYFKELMKGGQSVLDIGTGMVFFRKETKGLKKRETHKANTPIDNKNTNNEKGKSIFTYDLVKDRRYTENKYLFHLSIIQNYQQPKNYPINDDVNLFIKRGGIQNIIGIDRGERHLLYLSLIDMQGNVKKQFTLNEIVNEYNGNTYRTNYHDLLDVREKDRDKARKSWQTIENIKELKEGYLSQVIHKIAQLVVEYNAIVVLEDLNFGFMRGRQKVEKQVYQKFEQMLIDKLNYLVDKKKEPNENGGVLHALQLTSKFESFQKLGKQSGILFYIPAWNTSKMDPTTGFVNLLDTRYENMEKAKALFGKFESIRYNTDKNWFEFALDYDKFTTKAEGTQTRWTLCTYGNRIDSFPNPEKNSNWDSKEITLTEAFKKHFSDFQIEIKGNLKDAIAKQDKEKFFNRLLHLLKLTLQMRNSITDTETDYLISPVMNAKGEFYDSRTCGDNLPQNADANGAYNIARKGLWVVEQIKQAKDLKKLKLTISNKEWLQFAQNRNNL